MSALGDQPLWDAHVECAGYRDSPLAGEAFAPHLGALRLLAQAGVRGGRQLGVASELLYAVRAEGSEPLPLARGGAYLDGAVQGFRLTRLCRDEEAVERSLRVLELEGMTWVALGARLAPGLRAAALRGAAERGLACAVEGVGWPADAPPGSVEGLLEAVSGEDPDLPTAERVARLGDADPPALHARLEALVESEVRLVPLLLRARRASVLEEAVGAPGLDRLTAILPYHRHLVELRSPAAMRFGRRHVNRHLGFVRLDRAGRTRFERGWDALAVLLADFAAAGGVLAGGSGAPATGLCPGLATAEEAQIWLDAGLPVATVRTAFCETSRELSATRTVERA